VRVEIAAWDGVDGARLRAAQRSELDERYGNDDHEPGTAPTGDDVPVFVVARNDNGRVVGCGGLRFLAEGDPAGGAEIKRMYVELAARGSGAAVAILRALEHHARRAGVVRLVLETGTLQPEAIRFYQREGYDRIENFGPYSGAPQSVCFARDL
jgi:putative acetyltransferase